MPFLSFLFADTTKSISAVANLPLILWYTAPQSARAIVVVHADIRGLFGFIDEVKIGHFRRITSLFLAVIFKGFGFDRLYLL